MNLYKIIKAHPIKICLNQREENQRKRLQCQCQDGMAQEHLNSGIWMNGRNEAGNVGKPEKQRECFWIVYSEESLGLWLSNKESGSSSPLTFGVTASAVTLRNWRNWQSAGSLDSQVVAISQTIRINSRLLPYSLPPRNTVWRIWLWVSFSPFLAWSFSCSLCLSEGVTT